MLDLRKFVQIDTSIDFFMGNNNKNNNIILGRYSSTIRVTCYTVEIH